MMLNTILFEVLNKIVIYQHSAWNCKKMFLLYAAVICCCWALVYCSRKKLADQIFHGRLLLLKQNQVS